MKPLHIVIFSLVAWIVFLASPRTVLWIGLLTYIGLAAAIGWAALRHRADGWAFGLILALLLISLPFWVLGGYRFFEWMTDNSMESIPRAAGWLCFRLSDNTAVGSVNVAE